MAIPRNAYKALESIVGAENISEDPVVLDGYACGWGINFAYRPGVVALPGSTEEVQAIVKTCNRYGVTYKAISTGYFPYQWQKDVVVLDLRRMNRILEIDEKNKYAVVEPYVAWCQLQAEIYKVGLATTQIQAGSQASVLANMSSCFGMNWLGTHGGYNARNLLGVEWVLPTGELLRLGPPEAWFASDGPGPSLRGVLRGNCGHMGGLGVVTKCGVKLHSWPGPAKLETEKTAPPLSYLTHYRLKEKSELLEVYFPVFPSWENTVDFAYKAVDSELAYSLWGWGSVLERLPHIAMGLGGVQALDFAQSFLDKVEGLGFKEKARYPLMLLMFAESKEELTWKQKVLLDVVAETGGKILPELAETKVDGLSFQEMVDTLVPLWLFSNDTHFIFACGAGFAISAGYGGTCEAVWGYQYPAGEEIKREGMKPGALLNDAENTLYFNMFDNAPMTYAEIEIHYDPALLMSISPESIGGMVELGAVMGEEIIGSGVGGRKKYGFDHSDIVLPLLTMFASGLELEDLEGTLKLAGVTSDKIIEIASQALPQVAPALSELPEEIMNKISEAMSSDKGMVQGLVDLIGKRAWRLGEQSCDFHIWQERIKRALDPKGLSECSNYGVGKLRKELQI